MSAFTEPLAQLKDHERAMWGAWHSAEERRESTRKFDAALAQVERLATDMETALRKWKDIYPAHRAECNPLRPDGKGCTCGVDEAHRLTNAFLSAREEGAEPDLGDAIVEHLWGEEGADTR